jgi:DNA-binding transcriptional ArsR family regulator
MPTAKQNAQVFRAIADPTRRGLLDLLREGQYPALKLAERFKLTQPAISQHLKVLRQAGLVREHREGRLRIYELEARPLMAVRDWMNHYEQFWETKLDALGRHLERKRAAKTKK